MDKNLIEKLNSALAEEFEIEVEEITPDAIIKDVLDLDSLSLVDMIAIVEDVTGVKVKGAEFSQIKNFQNLYDCLDAHKD